MDPDPSGGPGLTALASLRRFVRPRAPREMCGLCGAALADQHPHLVEPASRRLVCACRVCAVLFRGGGATRSRVVPPRVVYLAGFRPPDELWEGLNLPIDLAFFLRSTPAAGVVAL